MNDELPSCNCAACQALVAQYQSDPELLDLYRRKLLIRGWAGRTTPMEKAYILAHAPWAQTAARVGRENLARRAAHVYNPLDQQRSNGIDISMTTVATSPTPTGPGEGCEINIRRQQTMVRSKFQVIELREELATLSGEKFSESITMIPVYSPDPEHENRAFWRATPSGTLTMHIENPQAFGLFHRGQEFYVDFTPA